MPLQTGINPTNATNSQPTVPIKSTSSDPIVSDPSDSRPQTNLSIKNAVSDLSGILSEIANMQDSSINSLSPELQQLVQDILQNSFSLDKTLAQSLGDTLQIRRYTFDQLATLGKFLTQLGDLMENGDFTELPTDIKTILTSFRSLTAQTGDMPTTVDLVKTAFKLLNGQDFSELPDTLKQLLKSNDSSVEINTPINQPLQSLKNALTALFKDDALITFTKPTATTEQSADNTETAARQSIDSSSPSDITPAIKDSRPIVSAHSSDNIATNTATDKSTSATSIIENTTSISKENVSAPPSVIETNSSVLKENNATIPTGEILKQAAAIKANINTSIIADATTSQVLDTPAVVNSQMPLLPDLFNNTPQSINALRELGQLALQNNELTSTDITLIKNFINGTQTTLPDNQAAQLQKVLQVITTNMPGLITQATDKQGLPNLAKLWAFIQLSDISTINETGAESLKQSGKDINDFSKIMNNSFSTGSATALTQKSLDFIIPIFFDEQKSYPAYINIYDDKHKGSNSDEEQHETWFRVCCLTENAGAVEIVLRLYNKQQLNIRLAFSNGNTAIAFEDYLPELRTYLHKTKLVLTELKIGAID
ncbi:hypothetical protein [Pectinatus frisingensis]|uniref:hypothetical protein n=1 Tax=Pectinatus frisingensis TaxID=865 RepID=UPI0018C66ACC|nr:hypothetical protein [Pectinatus frisingensis]